MKATTEKAKQELRATALYFAAARGYIDIVHMLLDAGADVNAANHHNDTPLLQAVCARHYSCVKVLLDHGASIGIANASGLTALHKAAILGYPEMIELLVSHGGADINAPVAIYNDKFATYTTLQLAIRQGGEMHYHCAVQLIKLVSKNAFLGLCLRFWIVRRHLVFVHIVIYTPFPTLVSPKSGH